MAEQPKKKGFISRIIEKLDKKMEQQAKNRPCCSGANSHKKKDSTCC